MTCPPRVLSILALLVAAAALGVRGPVAAAPPPPGAAALGAAVGATGGDAAVLPQIGVMAYFVPGEAWQAVDDAAPSVGVAVMNPATGPGGARDESYAKAAASARGRGIQLLGYVHTSYGRRAAVDVESEIDRYFTWYGVDGVFLDEVSVFCDFLPYFQTLHDYVKTTWHDALVVLDPGWQSKESECYLHAADVLITFEGSYTTYVNSFPAAAWTTRYPATRFWHLVYAVPTAARVRSVKSLSRVRNAGYLYVTPGSMPNPWDELPNGDYWAEELGSGSACLGTRTTGDATVTGLRVDACVPAGGAPDRPLSFTAAAAAVNPPTPEDIVFSWSFGDGDSLAGQDVTHAYAVAGTYTVTVTAASSSRPSLADTVSTVVAVPGPGMSAIRLVAGEPAEQAYRDYPAGWNIVAGPAGTSFPAEEAPAAALERGKGYWAYFARPVRVTFPAGPGGQSGAATDIAVVAQAGSSVLIGNSNPRQSVVVEGAIAVLAWDAAAGRYVETTTLAPGQGAWAVMPAEDAAAR